jgi:hypothetical protein
MCDDYAAASGKYKDVIQRRNAYFSAISQMNRERHEWLACDKPPDLTNHNP